MPKDEFHDIPANCPVTGGALYISELTSEDGEITLRGQFRIPKVAKVDRSHREFLEVFLRSRGVISTVEKELGISYPTVRARLDSLLTAMDLTPIKDDKKEKRKAKESEFKRRVLQDLEEGKITAEEAKAKMRGEAVK